MHTCSCGLEFQSEQAYAIHKVFCKYGVYLIVMVLAFLLFFDIVAALAEPAAGRVYLPVVVANGAMPTITPEPTLDPNPGITPRAEWSN